MSQYLNPDFEQANAAAQDDAGTTDLSEFYAFEALGESLTAALHPPQGDGYTVDTVDPDDPTPEALALLAAGEPDDDADYRAWLASVAQDPDYDSVLPSVEGGKSYMSLFDDRVDSANYAYAYSTQAPEPPKPDFHGVVVSRVYQQMCAAPAAFDGLIKARGYWQARLDIAAAEQDYLFYTYGADHSTDEVSLWVGEVMGQLGCTVFSGPNPPQPEPEPERLTAHYTEANVLAYMRRTIDTDDETNAIGLPRTRTPGGVSMTSNAAYQWACLLVRSAFTAFLEDGAEGLTGHSQQEDDDMYDWAIEVLQERGYVSKTR